MLLGGFDRWYVTHLVDEGANDLWAVGMAFAIGLNGIAQTGVTGSDEEGEAKIGFGGTLNIEH